MSPSSSSTGSAATGPVSRLEAALGFLAVLSPILSLLAVALFTGCTYKGAKVTEGTDLAIGLNIPVTEGTLQFQALNYLSGFRLAVDRNAIMRVKYTVAETNSYLGCVSTRVLKTVDATVEPCETSPEPTAASCAEPLAASADP